MSNEISIGRQNQRRGEGGERLAENVLRGRGLAMVEKIGTPIKRTPISDGLRKALRRVGAYHTKNLCYVKYGEKVSGDRRALIHGSGLSVLIETKTVLSEKLSAARHFKPHQFAALTKHREHGGLSLIVWIHESGAYVMEHPINGFLKGSPLDPEQAAKVDILDIPKYWESRRLEPSTPAPAPAPTKKIDPADVNYAMSDILDALDIPRPGPAVLIELFAVVEKLMTPKGIEQ